MADPGDVAQPERDAANLWPEDTVEYLIYCQESGRLEDRDDALSKLALECNHASRLLSGGHVWHFSAFWLRPAIAGEEYSLDHLSLVETTGGFFSFIYTSLIPANRLGQDHMLFSSCHSKATMCRLQHLLRNIITPLHSGEIFYSPMHICC